MLRICRVEGSKTNLTEVQIPLSVCWTCRNGQVWISISLDNAPQVVVHNVSKSQILYAEGNGFERQALHFPQYHSLSSCTLGFYTLPSSQIRFPDILSCYETPTLLIGRCSTGVEKIFKNVLRNHMLCRSKSDIIDISTKFSMLKPILTSVLL